MKLDVKELIGKILNTPVVVKTGTSGIWTYRKWSDGTAECWGTWSGNLTNYATVTTSMYAYCASVNFPSGLFTSAPVPTYSAFCNGGFALTGTQTNSLTKTASSYYLVSSASGTFPCKFHIYAIGKWK